MPWEGTFDLRADVTRDELTEIGYCKTTLAQNFVPAMKVVPLGRFFIGFEGFGDGVWHESLTGLLTLRPNIFRRGFWSSDTYEADKLTAADFTWGAGDFLTMYQQVIDSVACSPVLYSVHGNTAGEIDPFTGLPSLVVHGSTGAPAAELLDGGSASDYCYALQTLRTLATNEAFAFQVTNNDLAMASVFPAYGFLFGKFALLLGTAGRAEIWRNETEEDSGEGQPDEWRLVSNIDYSSSLDGQNNDPITVLVLPFSYRRLGLYIGPGMLNASWAGASGDADTSAVKRFIIDVSDADLYDEATELPDDPESGLYRITEPTKVTVFCRKTAQFSLGFYKVRFPSTEQTVHLTSEDLLQLYPETPEWTAYGARNRGSAAITTLNEDGTAWDPLEDRKMVAKIVLTPGEGLDTESASGEPIYSPEVNYATALVEPTIEEVVRSEADWTNAWESMTLARGIEGQTTLEINTIGDEYFYDWWRRHSYPVKLVLRDDISGTDYALFAGTALNPRSIITKLPSLSVICVDVWEQLRAQYTWDSPVWDGEEAHWALRWILNQGGVPDSRIYVSEAARSPRLPKPDVPQSYTYRAAQGEDLEQQAYRILDAGLDITMRERHAETGWIAFDGVTELTEEDYVVVIDVRPVFVDEESTPVVARFWNDLPVGDTWASENTRFQSSPNDIKVNELAPDVRGPLANVLTVDCPSSSGQDARRHSIANIVNFDALTNTSHRDYQGYKRRRYVNAATHGAKTAEDLTLLARSINDEDLKTQEYISTDGEWRPWIMEDTFVELYARNTVTQFMEKLGVYRVVEVAPHIQRATLAVGVKARYVLKWEAEGAAYLDPNEDIGGDI